MTPFEGPARTRRRANDRRRAKGNPVPDHCDPPSVSPLWKTRPCNFYQVGLCRNGSRCAFAHGDEDLRPSPDFERTSVCPVMLSQGECLKPGCRYAHTADELRVAPGLLKTKMCSFFLNGLCVVGEACRFAHSPEELQEAIAVQKAISAKTGPEKVAQGSETKASPWEQRRAAFLQRDRAPGSQTGASDDEKEARPGVAAERQSCVSTQTRAEAPRPDRVPAQPPSDPLTVPTGVAASAGANRAQPIPAKAPVPVPAGYLSPSKRGSQVPVPAGYLSPSRRGNQGHVAGMPVLIVDTNPPDMRAPMAEVLSKPSKARQRVTVVTRSQFEDLVVSATPAPVGPVQCRAGASTGGVTDIEDTTLLLNACRGCDNNPQTSNSAFLVHKHRRDRGGQGSPSRSTGRPCGSSSHGCSSESRTVVGGQNAQTATSWCRLGYAQICNAPAHACALCPRNTSGSNEEHTCAACNSGLKVIAQNTFLTFAEDDEAKPGSRRRTRSL